LELERHVADLVEEQGAAVSFLEQTGLGGFASVKAPRT